jgi:hypothetical protein
MRTYLILLFCLSPFLSISQDLPKDKNGEIEYAEIIQVDSASDKSLFSRAKIFCAKNFKSSTDVIKLEDAEPFTIVAKGLLNKIYTNPFNKTFGGNVKFTLTIQAKEGRYKYSINDLYHSDPHYNADYSGGSLLLEKPACGTLFMTKKAWQKIKEDTDIQIKKMIQNLIIVMADHNTSDKDNW